MTRTVTPVNASDVLRGVWQAVKLLTGDDGLHRDDHLTRLEVLAEARRSLDAAIDAELVAAHADPAVSLSQLGRALGMTKQAALKRVRNLEG